MTARTERIASYLELGEIDEGRLIRLRRAIRQVIEAASGLKPAVAAHALAEAYERFRTGAHEVIPEDHRLELDAICPKIEKLEGDKGRGKLFSQAKIALGALAGFLDGYVESADRNRNARDGKAGIYL